jgi:trk system potassium uptake protein
VKLKDARLPKGVLIGAIIRGDNVIIPSGDDIIREGDRIIVFALRQAISEVEKLI